MTNTEQITVLAIVAWVAYLVGTAKGQKMQGNSDKATTSNNGTTTEEPLSASMDWFINGWGMNK